MALVQKDFVEGGPFRVQVAATDLLVKIALP
jgi:hypothetical protein